MGDTASIASEANRSGIAFMRPLFLASWMAYPEESADLERPFTIGELEETVNAASSSKAPMA